MTDPDPAPGLLTSVVLKAAALCNLNCSYCYVYNHEDKEYLRRPKLIADEVFDGLLRAIGDYCDRRAPHSMFITFHGGEPMLLGPRRFAELVTRAREYLGERLAAMQIQTNGTLIDDEWVAVFRDYDIPVGISLDGPPSVHDRVRVDHLGRGSHAQVVRGIHRLQEAGLEPTILCVVNPGYDGRSTYRHFRELGITRMNFLLPDCSHDSKERFYGGLGETPVADFLIPIFDDYVAEDDEHVYVRIFWGLLRQMIGGRGETDQFGNPLTDYVVVETDGSIEALDVLRVCQSGMPVSGLNVVRHDFDDIGAGQPLLYQAVHAGFPLCAQCQACPERDICGGGFLPHRYSHARGFDNPSIWCKDILKLLRHIREWLALAPAVESSPSRI